MISLNLLKSPLFTATRYHLSTMPSQNFSLKTHALDSNLIMQMPCLPLTSHYSKPSKTSSKHKCSYCHETTHALLNCHVRVCKHCRKKGPGHYTSDCNKNPTKQSQPNLCHQAVSTKSIIVATIE